MSLQSGLPLFLGQLIRSPQKISAIAPSSVALARRMAMELPQDRSGPVVELGAGTGKITQALLESGVTPKDLHAFELNEEFVDRLHTSFPDIHVHHNKAQDMGQLGLNNVRAVVSGLPFLSMPGSIQIAILRASFRAMGPDGVYIQFTYGPKSPVQERVAKALALTYTKSETIWANLPPARVYSFRRSMV
ncbi:class I SAM-dependent methyltransferase [uncultured Pelagimonas sp.]|uniref:class I SAM-dependent methyltransferase n=1 Tax=uncultured Pelagimonas sp. TaxID=1618102 RepID=UPI00260825F0|nr:methyltransferase domain-containing protein [uncultured Pelagimonas sp.]